MGSTVGEFFTSRVLFDKIPSITWQNSFPAHVMPYGTTEVWRLFIPAFSNDIHLLYHFLVPEEQNKAKNFIQEQDKKRFIASKALLRFILGRYLNIDPLELTFSSFGNKKPVLAKPRNAQIHFNISHSGEYILIAISHHPIGIDVEQHVSFKEMKVIAERLFSVPEITCIYKNEYPICTFYELWTRKEALLKLSSLGVIDDIKLIPSLNGLHDTKWLTASNDNKLRVSSFYVDEAYAASVAYSSSVQAIMFKEIHEIK